MTYVRRLRVVGALLVLIAIVTTSHLWGEPAKQPAKKSSARTRMHAPDKSDQGFADDLAQSKFAKGGLFTYQTSDGDRLFADQISVKLESTPDRPRDLAVLIDTSASQAGDSLKSAQMLTEAIVKNARPQDRVSIWTINTPADSATRSLSGGFQTAGAKELRDAVEKLKQEVPMGDTDLKLGLNKVVAGFQGGGDRQQVILFLGDGMSVHNPITTADRTRLCEDMVKHEVVFCAVPLGTQLDPKNLHGLSTATGGTVVRLLPGEKMPDTLKRLESTLAAPILYPKEFKFTSAVSEFYPTVLPPLRGDAPTLVVGRVKGGDNLSYTLEGTVAGKEVRFDSALPIGESEPDNFFLISMVEQWKNAKDQPALTRADRALASYSQQTQVARTDLIAEAEWALAQDKLEAARDLFQKARRLDPQDIEAGAGLKLVEKIRKGLLNKQRLKDQLAEAEKNGVHVKLAQAVGNAPPPGEIAPPVEREDLLQQMKARAQVEQQRVTTMVEDAQREARRLLSSDPDAAHDILKRTYASVRDNPDLGEATRQLLSNRLETALRSVDTQGVRIKSDLSQRLRELADSRRRFDADAAADAENGRIKSRMQHFTNLMAQARYEDAYLQALAVQQDAINTGKPVPVAATAGYEVALAANNLSQIQELNRVRQERFLLTMMQVERSHIPFPDEPPIQFAPAQVWREITRLRKEKYESSGFTDDDPTTLQSIRRLKEKLSKPVTLEKGIDKNTPLRDALEFLSDRYDVTILVDAAAFKNDPPQVDDVEQQPVSVPKMNNVSLATILRLLSSQIQGTYLIRRDYIEFTTGTRAVTEKVVRVYPVADIVIPIPNAFNQSQVQNSLSIFGTAPGLGLNVGGPQALGGFQFGGGGLGALGGGLGALGGGLGALGGGLGALGGGLGALGGGLGALGGGLGGGGGFGGGLGAGGGGQVNIGAGGGQLGLGGGQLGQFGNLGGQFGLQGGDQSLILVELIRQVVGNPKEWQARGFFQRPPVGGFNPAPPGQNNPPGDDADDTLPPEQLNALGYYPPARALVVKGTSRIHTNVGGGLLNAKGGGGMGAANRPDRENDGKVAFIPGQNRRRNKAADEKSDEKLFANNGKQNNDGNKLKPEPGSGGRFASIQEARAAWQKELAKGELADPTKVWQEALARGVNDPGLIIACADFLADKKFYVHLAEFLKANLRQAIIVRPWVYDALAMALEESGGSTEEIERAKLSAVDLEPQDANSYVNASRAMAQNKSYDRAVAFCRQASLLEPNAPGAYEEALLMAELSKDTNAMEWAAGSLLRRDWPVENEALHQKASAKLHALAKLLQAENRHAEAQRLTQAVEPFAQRDMVIKLSWQGVADLDLEVLEPIQSKCSFMQRQTPGGGTLIGDTVDDMSNESYVLAKGFSGEYQITVRKIWGRPLGGKATVEIIQYQGTPQETRRRETIAFDRSHTMTVVLDNGRRTSAAYVPPPNVNDHKRTKLEVTSSDQVMNKLRALANPDFSGDDGRIRGGHSSLGIEKPSRANAAVRDALGETVYQTKVGAGSGGGVDLTAQATVAADQSVTLKFTPVFQSVGKGQGAPVISNPLIPGANDGNGGD